MVGLQKERYETRCERRYRVLTAPGSIAICAKGSLRGGIYRRRGGDVNNAARICVSAVLCKEFRQASGHCRRYIRITRA